MNSGWSQKCFINPEGPGPGDALPDTDRILRELYQKTEFQGQRIRFSAGALRSVSAVTRQGDWNLTVTLGFDGEQWVITRLEPQDTTSCHYGLCVDLGSTSIAMQLVDMETGTVKDEISDFNPQISYGTDILTRIFYAKDQPDHLEELRIATAKGLSDLMDALSRKNQVDLSACAAMIIAGNTTMIHFLLGLDAFCVFHTPYAPHTLAPDVYPAALLDIPMEGFVYCYPGKANYLGGDIISGLVAAGITRSDEIRVFLDIGTNGELAVGNREFLVAGAGAAGPALEGGVVRTGMRAAAGAVDQVSIRDGNIQIHTIGDEKAKGICGSGIVDLLAELFLEGWMDIRGKLNMDAEYVRLIDGEYAVEYAPGLYFYQSDIDEFLKTKAAASTMVEYMLRIIGLTLEDIQEFYVAGAFGTHISKESGVVIGLYPDIPRERLISPGNTSLIGARMMLLDRGKRDEADRLVEQMDYIQFGSVDDFLHLMTAATAVPHTDSTRYPSVMRKLEARKNKR